MTPLLVLITFAAILGVELAVQHRRRTVALAARARDLGPAVAGSFPAKLPPDILLHAGHTWVQTHNGDLASIGATDLAANFVGTVSSVALPKEGQRLRPGDSAWTLISTKNRRLKQAMPIDGKVLAVNRELLRHPGLVQRAPYESGWILRVKPRDLGKSRVNLFAGTAAGMWLEAARTAVMKRLTPALGAVAQDGGEWVTAFGDHLPDDVWRALERDLFPTTSDGNG